ncbi:glycosyl hydrolase [Saccharicrinis sp. 156]|uniref:glycosyl hydrolase n=1 Tax=Saccharicrinis sp. 156 TaxID=3417574 RepID=UPI003D350545
MLKNKSIRIFYMVMSIFLMTHCSSVKKDLSEEKFLNPTTEYRPLALWPWLNGFVDTTKLVYELEQMHDKGLRGAVIWDIGSLADPDKIIPEGPAFLGKQSLNNISIALKTSKKLGLDLGMVASSSWNAGGEWVDSTHASMQLLSTSHLVEGPGTKKITIGIPESQWGETRTFSRITSIAVPYSDSGIIDTNINKTILLDDFISEGKFINWQVPEGKWEVLTFFMCNTGQNLVCPSPKSKGLVIDHLSYLATQSHFDSIISRLSSISTPDNHLKFFMLDSYEVWQMKDWSPRFIQEFKARYQYNPIPHLPLLLGHNCKDSVFAERFRGDYSRLVSDMMIENHFAQSVDIAEKNGMKMLTEAGHGGSPRVDPLKALGNSHIPMGEFWNRKRHWVTKEAASAAHIYGKKTVAAESLTGWNHWQHGPTDFKQLIDIAFCEGLNQVVFHTFDHNPEIAGKPGFAYHAGEHVNANATWWPYARPFMDYIARCSYMLRQGNFVGDACLYYGDQAPNLVPPRRIDPNIKPIFTEDKCLHCGDTKPVDAGDLPGYSYDYINADIISNALISNDGKLVLPSGQSYKVMLLPDRNDRSLEVLKSLEKLVFDGAVVIGPKPERTPSLKNYPSCDLEVKEIAGKMWGNCDGEKILSNKYGKGTVYWGKSVKEVLEELNIPPDFEAQGIDNCDYHIDFIHRQTETEELYFISNSSPASEKITGIFRVDQNMIPEIWDAETGLIQRDVVYSKVKNGISIELQLEGLSSRFIVFRNNSTRKNDAGLNYDLQFGFNKKQKVTEVSPIDLGANWEINFDANMGAPKSHHLEKLTSWSDIGHEGIKYYSGAANYKRNFTVAKEAISKKVDAFVVFEDVQEIAQVKLNGNDCGIIWTPPYKANITPFLKQGTNEIEVQVVNAWNNRILGDLRNPNKKSYTNTNVKYKFNPNSSLLKSGLIGNAEIIFYKD